MTEALNNKNINESQKADLYYAIAIAYEKMSKNEDFFKYLKKANKLYKNKNEFKKEKNLKFINSIIYFFKDFDFNDEFNFFNEKKIIFICGLPRSGTTLVEQILSSHTKVSGQGELEYLSWDIDKNFLNDGKFDKEKFDQVLLRKNNILSNSYFKRLKFHEIKENIITDKMPMNFRLLGFILSNFLV